MVTEHPLVLPVASFSGNRWYRLSHPWVVSLWAYQPSDRPFVETLPRAAHPDLAPSPTDSEHCRSTGSYDALNLILWTKIGKQNERVKSKSNCRLFIASRIQFRDCLPVLALIYKHSPLASLEISIRLASAAPVSWPTIVTRLGSPPNAAMFSLVHRSAAIMSSTPRLPGGLVERVFRNPKSVEAEGRKQCCYCCCANFYKEGLGAKLMCGTCRGIINISCDLRRDKIPTSSRILFIHWIKFKGLESSSSVLPLNWSVAVAFPKPYDF